jgi:ribosomal protein S18 acetylase RimI-like enzyme
MGKMAEIIIREATIDDLPQIIKLMADDFLGSQREEYKIPLPKCYINAFENILKDKNNILLVVCDGKTVLGNLQITFTQYLSHKGSLRATIENVRVVKDKRNFGIGTQLMSYAIHLAKERNCLMIQLTTNKTRSDAQRFYKRLGFQNTHEGMKLNL